MKNDIFKTHFSLTVSGTGNNNFCPVKGGEETEFLSWYRIRRFGRLEVAIKYFNIIYSTGCGTREQRGEPFTVVSAHIGVGKKASKAPEHEVSLTFGGKPSITVTDGFESDDAEIFIPDGYMLSVRLTVRSDGDCLLPSTDESASSGYRNGLRALNVLRPNFIGARGDFEQTLIFFGDSITQGTRTRTDKYEAWAHRAALAAPPEINVINLGMGWSRAHDAAADGIFLRLASYADRITVCFGVNDIKSDGKAADGLISDLRRTIALLKSRNPNIDIILFTIPPFNLDAWGEEQRQIVNSAIVGGEIHDKCFDLGGILEGETGRVKPEYMAAPDNAHPNGLAGEIAARELLRVKLLY